MADNSEFIKSISNATLQIIADETKKVNTACLILEGAAKQKCPKDQGILAASLISEVGLTESEIVGRVGTNQEYGPYVHNGTGIYAKDGNGRKTPWKFETKSGKYKGWHITRGQRPQPFLENAKLEKRSAIEKALGD